MINEQQKNQLKAKLALFLGISPDSITIETKNDKIRIDITEVPTEQNNLPDPSEATFPSPNALSLLSLAGLVGGIEYGPKLMEIIKAAR